MGAGGWDIHHSLAGLHILFPLRAVQPLRLVAGLSHLLLRRRPGRTGPLALPQPSASRQSLVGGVDRLHRRDPHCHDLHGCGRTLRLGRHSPRPAPAVDVDYLARFFAREVAHERQYGQEEKVGTYSGERNSSATNFLARV